MGIRDVIERVWASPCERIVKYHGRSFDFVPVVLQAGPSTISLAGLKTHEEKIEKAGELVILLDIYQYMLCIAARGLSKRKREKYSELRIGAIGVLTSLHGCFLAFKADPNGQEEKLNEAVRVMQEFFGKVAKHSLQFLAPKLRESIGAGKPRIRIRESAPQLNQERVHSYIRKEPFPEGKASEPVHPTTLARLLRAKAMSDALNFAGLSSSDVKQMAKELSQKTP